MALNPTAAFYDNLGMKYEESFGHDEGLVDFIKSSLKFLPSNASVLDIGSGTGKPLSSMVIATGRKLHGIDFSPVMIALSRQQVPTATFEEVNMLQFIPKEPYHAAFAIFSLFHFSREEMNLVAEKFAQWILPGGYLFIGTMTAEDFHTKPHMFDDDKQCARGIEHTFMGKRIGNLLYTRAGWVALLQKVNTELVQFQAPPHAQCDSEPHYYITARKMSP
ncbi:hypothetical protein HYALB_00004755 [Hymenoscyphus albidus]|uniref:phosphoethanolamine N-methyltransferase n=1 Tax=Hymenoscyphus albidus TaxID=595503 RepID=A0A9N9QBU0_9HELO|nr:hypothetical protein HYALB_00004755 [Hymenoscyphus albidus]